MFFCVHSVPHSERMVTPTPRFLGLYLRFSSVCAEPPGERLILQRKPSLSLLSQDSLGSNQALNECILAHTQIALAHPLLIPARLHSAWKR